MRVYRCILGILAAMAIIALLGVFIYGVSRSDFYISDIPYAAGLLLCVYTFLQYMFLIKFGFYNQNNADHYNKKITIGIPIVIVLLLAGYIGLHLKGDTFKRNRSTAQEHERLLESTSYLDFYKLFDYPQQIPKQIAVKFLKIDSLNSDADSIWTVSRHLFDDILEGVIYKTHHHGNERITLATFIGSGTLVDKIEIGYTIMTPSMKQLCRYEIQRKNFIELEYQKVKKSRQGKESVTIVKKETYLVDDGTGKLRIVNGQFD